MPGAISPMVCAAAVPSSSVAGVAEFCDSPSTEIAAPVGVEDSSTVNVPLRP